jgi:hypothetical protein
MKVDSVAKVLEEYAASEYEDTRYYINVSKSLPDYTVSYPNSQHSSHWNEECAVLVVVQ